MSEPTTYVAFSGPRRVAAGPLAEVLPALKARFDRDRGELILVFDLETGRQVDFDLRGTPEEVAARATPGAPRGPGRPRLGVVGREVSLLPRHWDWLEAQPSGASAALRRLVDLAIRHQPAAERARHVRTALGAMLTSLAGDRPGYEEATRALWAGDLPRFEAVAQRWPKDVRELAVERARAAAEAARDPGPRPVV